MRRNFDRVGLAIRVWLTGIQGHAMAHACEVQKYDRWRRARDMQSSLLVTLRPRSCHILEARRQIQMQNIPFEFDHNGEFQDSTTTKRLPSTTHEWNFDKNLHRYHELDPLLTA